MYTCDMYGFAGRGAKHRGELEALARALLERETLDEEEILEVTGLPPAPPLENRKVPGADPRA
jgi:cell division protease FtsH